MNLKEKIDNGSARVGVVGLGYVGLPLLHAFLVAGFPVIGFDIDDAKIQILKQGKTYLKHLGQDMIRQMLDAPAGQFDVTSDLGRLGACDVIISCVPTPLGKHLEPDLSYVEQTAHDIAKTLRKGQLVVLESSTYPGTTRQIILPALEASGLKLGDDFFLAYSPEREDPGRKDYNTRTIPKLVGGCDAKSTELAVALYAKAVQTVIPCSSAEVAEAAKILENTYRAVNIALVNEMKVVLDAMGIDIWEVIDAAKTKPFGFQAFYPGPGLGGHCIPIDPYYLTWKARETGRSTRFIELAGEVNRSMPDYVIHKTLLALNEQKKPVNGSRILVLGLSYKPDVDDVRESPSFELIERLEELGASVDYSDPHVAQTHPMRRWGDIEKKSLPLSPKLLQSYDCIVIATHHRAFDWQMIGQHARLIIDTRNAMVKVANTTARVIKA